MGQVELFVGKGDGRLKAHLVCPDKGICLEKVISRSRFGHRLIRKFVVSCVELETSKVDNCGQIPCTLDRCATLLSSVFRKKERTSAHSLWVLFPGSLQDPHLSRRT